MEMNEVWFVIIVDNPSVKLLWPLLSTNTVTLSWSLSNKYLPVQGLETRWANGMLKHTIVHCPLLSPVPKGGSGRGYERSLEAGAGA